MPGGRALGRVQGISIRSSKLLSVTGSEIIVPNGDLLSNHVINWTHTNIRQEQLTKSEILAGIYRRFTAQGLTLS